MKTTKRIEYSYPTSPNAERFRLQKGGYCVVLVKYTPTMQPGVAIAGFPTLEHARAWAELRPEPWDRLTR